MNTCPHTRINPHGGTDHCSPLCLDCGRLLPGETGTTILAPEFVDLREWCGTAKPFVRWRQACGEWTVRPAHEKIWSHIITEPLTDEQLIRKVFA